MAPRALRRVRTAWRLLYAALWLTTPFPASAASDAARTSEPAAEAVLATLPFDPQAPAGKIVIDLAPQGNARKLEFQLDTGAADSWVSPGLAREMGVKARRTKGSAYRRKTILGRDLQFHIDAKRSDAASNVGFEFGLLGGSFLSHYVVELDFANRHVRFLDPERYAVPAATRAAQEAVLPLKIVANRPGLVARIEGRNVLMLIDTGAQPGLVLSTEIAEQASIESTPRTGAFVQGVVGKVDLEVAEVERLEIGPFVLERVDTLVLPSGYFNQGLPGDCVLGYDLLSQFLVRIDYPRARIWLRRIASTLPSSKPQPDLSLPR
jgi:predicted aspartyl protease